MGRPKGVPNHNISVLDKAYSRFVERSRPTLAQVCSEFRIPRESLVRKSGYRGTPIEFDKATPGYLSNNYKLQFITDNGMTRTVPHLWRRRWMELHFKMILNKREVYQHKGVPNLVSSFPFTIGAATVMLWWTSYCKHFDRDYYYPFRKKFYGVPNAYAYLGDPFAVDFDS